MRSLIGSFFEHAAKSPGTLFAADPLEEYTYGQAKKTALTGASYLAGLGIREGDRVLVECSQDAAFLVCRFAVILAGGIFVPLEHGASADTLGMIEEDTEASLFIFDDRAESKKKTAYETRCPMVAMRSVVQAECGMKSELPGRLSDEDAVCEILYTTGTTGRSKGIEITFRNNVALAENVMYGVEMKEGNTELLPLPLSHSHALRCFYANLLKGGTVIVTNGVTRVKQIFELMDRYTVTALDLSPSAAGILLKLSKDALAGYRQRIDYIQIGTAPLTEDIKGRLMELLPEARLYNFYGSTESGRTCVLNFAGQDRPGCIGLPTKNARFIVTDENRRRISSSKENPGLLASAGPMNMKGYWRREDLTQETVSDGFVFSNDLGYIDKDGYIYVLGRRDDVINYKGIKISPEEIECVAASYEGVLDCACVAKKDETSGEVPKLFLVLKDGYELDRKAFGAFLNGHIDANKLPKEIELIDSIPRTSNGKLRRALLRERA